MKDVVGGAKVAEPSETHYPSFTYDGPEKIDIPEEGIMEVRYKKVASSEHTRDGKTTHTCTIEVHAITDVESEGDEADEEAPTKNYGKDTEDALDNLAKEKSKSKEY